ncbi:DUF362 domain-containing protein [bacterium]|nr:DUF362 domain-containing protein [bacterium]
MITRREFLKTAAVGTIGLGTTVQTIASRSQNTGYFGLHPFIENHPEAVFIMRTSVEDKMNAEAKLQAGLAFGRSVFVPRDETGIPITISIPVKPNMKTADPFKYDMESIISHVTDPYFVEGSLASIIELGVPGGNIHLREVNRPEHYGVPYGFSGVAERLGADIRLDQSPDVSQLKEGADFNWVEIPDGTFYKRIPYLEPINTPDTWMLNLSKFKAHGMGLTLCCKNLQGSVAHNYQQFCANYNAKMSIYSSDQHADAYTVIKANFDRHLAAGVPRWDKPGSDFNSGIGMETWVTRTLDNLSVTPCGLHVIEGIYGRDGQGNSDYGPNPIDQPHDFNTTGVSSDGKAWDWMSNVIIFGKDSFRVDIIGYWLGGHEPGNIGLFHCAIDKGMSTALDPNKIPVYLWDNGTATLTPLQNFERTPLLTYYLCRNYNGQTEFIYHLMNEPYDYGTVTGIEEPSVPEKPEAYVLYQNKPNPFNPYTSIEYSLPKSAYARLEIYNSFGQLVEVLVDGYRGAGTHMAVWNTMNRASGIYFYRFRSGGFTETKKMTLVK